jgi:hypothetical protein
MHPSFRLLHSSLAALALCLTHCAAPGPAALSRVTAQEALSIAESYRVHRWQPSAANVLHGPDADGVHVDTPDVSYTAGIPGWWKPGVEAEGVPYQWGGFSTLSEFDRGVAAGQPAGDVYTTAKRQALDDAVSAHAVGIDCSGFISRCWKLPRSYSTRELPGLCKQIPWAQLQPGDVLNTHNAHCLLFAGWADEKQTELIAYETGSPPTWKVLRHPINTSWLQSLGYKAYRYAGMRTQ